MKIPLYLFFALCTISSNAQLHQLIATAMFGGPNNQGTILAGDSNGNNFHVIYSFTPSTGRWPMGRFTMDASGMVYGVTKFGGLDDSCVIYSYDLLTDSYTMIHDFYATQDLGWWDQTGPILLSDGKLYGVTQAGGANELGTIYRINPSTQDYEDLYDLGGDAGGNSESGLLYASDGYLYGMTPQGGIGDGTLFRFDPVTDSLTVLHGFVDSTGTDPATGSLIEGNNKILYGAVQQGGEYEAGAIFSYNLTTNVYTCLHLFNGFDGAAPQNPLLLATNGKLYGVTYNGSYGSAGNLFSYDLQTDSFTVLVVFNDTIGGTPQWGLTQALNGKLYGTNSGGGLYNGGVIFSYDIDSNAYSIIFNLDSATGSGPAGAVFETFVQLPLSILAITEQNNLLIYPNPSVGSWQLTIGNDLIGSNVDVFDEQGRLVFHSAISNQNSEIKFDAAPGVYYLRISNENVSVVRKLVKM